MGKNGNRLMQPAKSKHFRHLLPGFSTDCPRKAEYGKKGWRAGPKQNGRSIAHAEILHNQAAGGLFHPVDCFKLPGIM